MATMYFLVTSPLYRQFDAMWELEWAFGDDAKVKRTPYPGVILVTVPMERDAALEAIRAYETTAIHRAIPLDEMIPTDKGRIIEQGFEMARERIAEGEAFAVRCKRRGNKVPSSKDIERELGARIVDELGAVVNLDYPKKIVKVEILGNRTGISVITPDEIIDKDVLE